MIYSAGDFGIAIDFGSDEPGWILQRKEKGYWRDYLVDGEPVTNPFDVETLWLGGIGCGVPTEFRRFTSGFVILATFRATIPRRLSVN